ncbi:hypothetical protein [Rubritalea marina]|uniref:hypothetical protein n=1 Tax=Rubritalea marina TaxID=361055 RepID=UPI0003AB003D|nr:hypothetical protein [Rubritalea marina]
MEQLVESFDMGKYEHINSEQKKAWDRIVGLEKRVDSVVEDWETVLKNPEHTAKNDAATTKGYRTRGKKALEELQSTKQEVEGLKLGMEDLYTHYDASKGIASQAVEDLKASKLKLDEKIGELQDYIEGFDSVIEEHPDIEQEIKGLAGKVSEGNELLTKASNTHKSILRRKEEVDEAYFDIYGYEDEDELGQTILVEGKKDRLEKSFNDLTHKAESIEKQQTQQIESIDIKFKEKADAWKGIVDELSKQVKDLMPEALTKGLSAAYSKKKTDEEATLIKHEGAFVKSIRSAVGVSLIPFSLGVYMLFNGNSLDDVILKAPSLASSVLPIYIPIIWMAYSADKKAKLSKRLIEEYTHKEVLSKTYEGLSTQVNALPDEEVSAELRVKLLTNVLNISGENPGKLISDYNKSDHPVIDVLEQSTKLTESFEKLQSIPGIGKLAERLIKRSEDDIEKTAQKASKGLDQLDESEIA